MRIWLREILGVILIFAGLAGGGICVYFFNEGYIIEGAALVMLCIFLLISGTHLLKVAMAVRLVMQEHAKN